MTKKLTPWVTIPEEKHNAAASVSASADKSDLVPVKNKIFWGFAFVLMILVVTALLAPKQAASVLQGNLFAQSGIEGADEVTSDNMGIKPLNLIPAQDEAMSSEDAQVDDMTNANEDITAEDEMPTPAVQDKTVVSAETDAVTIQVEPVEVTVEPISDSTTVTEEATPAEADTTDETPVVSTESDNMASEETVVDPAIQEELDNNRKLLEELSKQIAQFQEKDKQNNQAIQDLTEIVKDEMTHPAADSVTPAETTTVLLGQKTNEVTSPVISSAGYRVNVHAVKITPQQALQQNTARIAMQQTASSSVSVTDTAYSDYSAHLSQAQATPDSGPRESILLAFILSFAAMLGWRFFKFICS